MKGLYVDVLTKMFESGSFITNTTGKKVLFLNEYSNASSKSTKRNLQGMNDLYVDVLTEMFES
jgi:hypothetical protein